MEALLETRGTTTDCPLAIIVRDGKLLTGLRHYTADKYKDISVWTLPGGRCDEGETLETTLRRELFEEIGVSDFSIEQHLGSIPGAKAGDTVHLFVCNSNQDPVLKEPEKFGEWRFAKPEDIYEEFINKEVLLYIKEKLFN